MDTPQKSTTYNSYSSDVVGVALDGDIKNITFYKNGSVMMQIQYTYSTGESSGSLCLGI